MCVSLAVAAGCYDSMPPSMLISKRSRKPKAQALNPLTTVWAASALVLRSSTPAFVGIQEGIHLGAGYVAVYSYDMSYECEYGT